MNSPGRTASDGARGGFVSIGVKLAAAVVAVVAVVTVCVYVALSSYERANLLESKEAAASMVTRLYVAMAVAPLTFGDDKGVQDVVALLAANGDVVHASAWGVAEKSHHLGDRLGELRRGDAVEPPTEIPADLRLRRTATALIVEAPVTDPTGKLVGVVQAAFSLAREQEALAQMERRTLAISIITSALLAAILLLAARRLIIQPLARLVGAANAIASGGEATVTVTTNDEIGRLGSAFVSMSKAIEQREQRIAERNRDLRRVLDNVEDGFVAATLDGALSGERSRVIDEWFGAPTANATLFEYLGEIMGKKAKNWLTLGWETLRDDVMPIEVAIDQLPSKFERAGRFYSVAYRPILNGATLTAMLIVIRDETDRLAFERAEAAHRQMMVILSHIITDRADFDTFFKDTGQLLQSIQAAGDLDEATLRRHIHTVKGNAAIYGLDMMAARCHQLETRMADDGEPPTPEELAALRAIWDDVARTYAKFDGPASAQLSLQADEQRDLLEALRSGVDAREIVALVTSWQYERASQRMSTIGDQVVAVARRLGKGDVDVEIAPTRLRLPPHHWSPFWSVFGHVVRNTVDHGIEEPEKRALLGKPEKARIRMAFEESPSEVVFRFSDDGAGIDWDRLASKARERGLPAEGRTDLENALFADSVSTRDEATATSGRGVGMSSVLSAVTAKGGAIQVESTRGAGTAWVFRFPKTMLAGEVGESGVGP